MNIDHLPNHIVYSKNVIEFTTVVAEVCLFLEHASDLKYDEFVVKSIKLLPLLYLKASLIEIPNSVFDDGSESFVNEADYQYVRNQVEVILGSDDSYLEVFHPDMAISDTPIAAFISENLADIYQELKDYASNYQLADVDIMNDALVVCLENFGEHWGQKLLNALRALHSLRFSDGFANGTSDDEATESTNLNKNSFLEFLSEDKGNENIGIW